jgi:hypothetical protein
VKKRFARISESVLPGPGDFYHSWRCLHARLPFLRVSKGSPLEPDPEEPERVAEAVRKLGLKHAVITSVTRDDLPDGGASVFARTILALRRGSTGSVSRRLSRISALTGIPAQARRFGPGYHRAQYRNCPVFV